MLTITRHPGERIMIGDEIVVEVIEVTGTNVRLGISAPREITIYREELWDRVKEENAAAAEAAPGELDRLDK